MSNTRADGSDTPAIRQAAKIKERKRAIQDLVEKLPTDSKDKRDLSWVPRIALKPPVVGENRGMEESRGFEFDRKWLMRLREELVGIDFEKMDLIKIEIPLSIGEGAIKPEEFKQLVAGLETFFIPSALCYKLYIDPHGNQSDATNFFEANKETLKTLGATEEDFKIKNTCTQEEAEKWNNLKTKVVLIDNWRLSSEYKEFIKTFNNIKNEVKVEIDKRIEIEIKSKKDSNKKSSSKWADYPDIDMRRHLRDTAIDLMAFEGEAKRMNIKRSFLFYPYKIPLFLDWIHKNVLDGVKAIIDIKCKGFMYKYPSEKKEEKKAEKAESSQQDVIQIDTTKEGGEIVMKKPVDVETMKARIALVLPAIELAHFAQQVGITDATELGLFYKAARGDSREQTMQFLDSMQKQNKIGTIYNILADAGNISDHDLSGSRPGSPGIEKSVEKTNFVGRKAGSSNDWHMLFGRSRQITTRTTTTTTIIDTQLAAVRLGRTDLRKSH